MQKNNSFILWLPSWYPNQLSPYAGDFIQRHATAVSSFIPIHVLCFVRDKKKRITDSIHIEENRSGNLTETIVYYSATNSSIVVFDKFFSDQKFTKLYKKIVPELFQKNGKPLLVHVHVAFKAGMIAGWIRKKYKIPFFLSEHWTIYLDGARPNLKDLNFMARYFISKSITRALKIFVVSDYLGKEIQKRWSSINFKVIPNVVNIDIFYPAENANPDEICRLVHISDLNYQKDPERLFEAMGILKRKGIKFSLDVFGPFDEYINSLVIKEEIEQVVRFHKEIPQSLLAEHIRKSDALILYSRYETFGCVIIEANACGIPAIVTDTPLMHELVTDGKNGMLVRVESSKALAEALENFFNNRDQFNKEIIAGSARRYSYQEIGRMFFEEYVPFTNST